MKSLKRIFTGMLIIFVMNLFLSHMTFAEHRVLYAKAGVTEHEPEILSTPEEDMPTVKVKKKSWGWYILLVLIAGGAQRQPAEEAMMKAMAMLQAVLQGAIPGHGRNDFVLSGERKRLFMHG